MLPKRQEERCKGLIKMQTIYLTQPSESYASQVMDLRKEMLESGDGFDGCGGLEDTESFEEWINFEKRLRLKYKSGYVPSRIYLAVRKEDGKVVGIIDYRSPLTEFLLKYGGNIGYSVRPSERGNGYAAEMLRLILPICRDAGEKRVLVTCDKDNVASRKSIIKNGGVLENEILDGSDLSKCGVIQRFWIKL